MSHKTEIKTQLTDREYLKQALDKLGFKYTEAKKEEKLITQGYYRVHEEVDIRIDGQGSINYNGSIGFVENADGTFNAVGDFYGLRTEDGQLLSPELLKNEITASAKQSEVQERLTKLDFSQCECEENKDQIIMCFERWTN